ncbi:hypothetical protein SKAU_G00377610 [Synaphobranchus kaupii]|uniref:Uncharacterized protein n=1 Tax=Synaphobranchus kaupii TaxID=118154 RepID=A0A9Q1IED4_SYNKA|nr:hypothetical protein SKAU_G00377610 [Synaphobranchus kaupii]
MAPPTAPPQGGPRRAHLQLSHRAPGPLTCHPEPGGHRGARGHLHGTGRATATGCSRGIWTVGVAGEGDMKERGGASAGEPEPRTQPDQDLDWNRSTPSVPV